MREYQKTRDFVFFHVKNDVGGRRGNFFYDLKPMGVLPGVSDFCILKSKKIVFLEIKRKKGKLSQNQKDFITSVQKLGHEAFVAYGWEEIEKTATKIINI